MNKKDTSKTKIEIDLNTILLEELLMSIGGVLFAGAEIQEIDTPLLSRLEDLIQAEVLVRENNLSPARGIKSLKILLI